MGTDAFVTEPWFKHQAGEDRHDREVMPHQLVYRLLLDESFQPGARPSSVINASGAATMEQILSTCLPRSRRVFKEYCPVPRRTNSKDFWHNAGGNRSKKAVPSPEKPLLWRWYGAIEQLTATSEGVKRMATYNYHAYKLAGHVDGEPPMDANGAARIPVIYHIFTSRTLCALENPKQTRKNACAPRYSRHVSPSRAGSPEWADPTRSDDPRCTTGQPRGTTTSDIAAPMVVLDTTAKEGQANFLSFEKAGRTIGDISLNKTSGISLQSRGGDVAEWHGLEEPREMLLEGDIVAVVK
eukprot:COSAG02_NODE_5271_length_4480_cov_42.859849_2_plen_297_part_00